MNEPVITLRDTIADEVPLIAALESAHGDNFVMAYSLGRHYREFDRPEVLYKSVYRSEDLIGFAILVLVLAVRGRDRAHALVHLPEDQLVLGQPLLSRVHLERNGPAIGPVMKHCGWA